MVNWVQPVIAFSPLIGPGGHAPPVLMTGMYICHPCPVYVTWGSPVDGEFVTVSVPEALYFVMKADISKSNVGCAMPLFVGMLVPVGTGVPHVPLAAALIASCVLFGVGF